MAYDPVRARTTLIRVAKAGPGRLRGPLGRATRRFRSEFSGPLVTVVLAVSDDDTTRIGPCLDSLRAQTYRNLDVLVVRHGRHDQVTATVSQHAAEDWRIRLRHRVEGSLAGARNAGVARARGELVLVVAGGDDLVPFAVERLVGAHQLSGSPLVVGRVKEPDTAGWIPDSPFDAAHHTPVRGTTLAQTPLAVTDLGLGNKLFTTTLWREAGLAFADDLASGADVALGLLRSAPAFDLLTEFTYVPTGRRDGVGVGSVPDLLSNLDRWLAEHESTWRHVEALGLAEARDWWLWGVLDAAVQPLLADAERADDRQWATLRDHVDDLLGSVDEHLWARLSAESRVKLWLLQHDKRDELAAYAAARLFLRGNRPTVVRDGRVWAQLPFHDDPTVGVPAELFEMTEEETRLRTTLREARWVGDGDAAELELTVFAAIDFVHLTGHPEIACVLVDTENGARIELPVERYRDPRANQGGRRYQDFSWGAFIATVSLVDVVAASVESGLGRAGRAWTLEVSVSVDGVRRSGPVVKVDDQGSAGLIGHNHHAPRPVAGAVVGFAPRGHLVGLRVRPDDGPRLRSVAVQDRVVTGVLDASGADVVAVQATMGSLQARGEARPSSEGVGFRIVLPAAWTGQRSWNLRAVTASGAELPVGWPSGHDQWLGVGGGEVVASRDESGAAEIREVARLLAVDAVELDDLELTLTARWLAAAPPPDSEVRLEGPKAVLPGVVEPGVASGQVRVRFPLVSDPWGLGPQPVTVGWHWFTVTAGGESVRAVLGEQAVDQLHRFLTGTRYAARLVRAARDCGVELLPPLAPDERGPYAQASLQEWYAAGDIPLDEDAVYLQSYMGASATDSQLAIHEELRRSRPDLTIYWGVAGSSSWVPEGGVPVVMNSREWYHVLASAKYLCMNIDPERWFRRRPGQQLLQTFHGYPAKSMGLRMWVAKHFTPHRIDLELARTSGNWDLILTPAPEMDEHYRREYAYDGPIHSQGYPRDDLLVAPEAAAVREDTRRRLGVRPDQKVVLYAPTWRDDLATNWRAAEMVQHLDLASASRALGPDYVLLMRGHRFHSAASSPSGGGSARYLDVTDYPEINHLILASDAAVLDYSSLRFDFALTMRPMIFLVPDLDSYVGGVRGFLYDYRASAPGPIVDTAEEAVRLLRDIEGLRRRCTGELRAFHDRFNYLQDGHAAERVVDAFFGGVPNPG